MLTLAMHSIVVTIKLSYLWSAGIRDVNTESIDFQRNCFNTESNAHLSDTAGYVFHIFNAQHVFQMPFSNTIHI